MHDQDTQHPLRRPRALCKAAAWAILSLAALASAYVTTRSARGLTETVLLLGITLSFGYLGAWGVFASLRVERHFNVVAIIAGLVLGTLPLALIFSSGPTGTEPLASAWSGRTSPTGIP